MLRILHHAATGGEGREEGRKDGDHDVANATKCFLGGFFHWTHPQPLPKQGGEYLLRGIWFLDD